MPLTEAKSQRKTLSLFSGFTLIPCLAIASYRLVHWATTPGSFTNIDSSLNFLEIGAQALMMIVLMLIERRVSYTERTVTFVIIASAVAQVLGSMLILTPTYYGSPITFEFVSNVGIILRGFGSAALLLGLGRYLCSIEPRKSALYIAAGYTIFGFVSLLLTFASQDVVAFSSLIFPLLTCLCLLWSTEKVKFKFENHSHINYNVLTKLPLDLVFLLLLCALTNIVIGVFVPPSITKNLDIYSFIWPFVYLLILVTYCIWIFRFKRSSVSELWPFLMLIILSGLLCYSSFSIMNADLAASFIRATQKTLILFCWVFLATAIYQFRLPSVFFFGLGNFVFIQLPALLSFLGRALIPAPSAEQTTTIDIAIIAIIGFILIVAVVFVLMRSKNSNSSPTQTTSNVDASRVVELIAERYSLTSREEEIASYVVRGYTYSQMAAALFISADTVRSHSKNLYRKMGIHKKQELIKIVENITQEIT